MGFFMLRFEPLPKGGEGEKENEKLVLAASHPDAAGCQICAGQEERTRRRWPVRRAVRHGFAHADVHRAGPCVAVLAGRHFFIVDAGEGSTRNVLLMNLPVGKADAILLTHFHSDHIADLGEWNCSAGWVAPTKLPWMLSADRRPASGGRL